MFLALLALTVTNATTKPVVAGHDAVIVATVSSDKNVNLTGATSDAAASIMVHKISRAGMVKDSIPVIANHPRVLSSHGYHLMGMKFTKTLRHGDSFTMVVNSTGGSSDPVIVTVN